MIGEKNATNHKNIFGRHTKKFFFLEKKDFMPSNIVKMVMFSWLLATQLGVASAQLTTNVASERPVRHHPEAAALAGAGARATSAEVLGQRPSKLDDSRR